MLREILEKRGQATRGERGVRGDAPSVIMSSAARRDAMPAVASALLSRTPLSRPRKPSRPPSEEAEAASGSSDQMGRGARASEGEGGGDGECGARRKGAAPPLPPSAAPLSPNRPRRGPGDEEGPPAPGLALRGGNRGAAGAAPRSS